MIAFISECNDFLKECGFPYAFCGGYALELFTNKMIRAHSDIDICILNENRTGMVDFLLGKGWCIYVHQSDD